MFNPLSRIDSEHRAVVYLVNQQPEFERLEELTADTIRSARRAVSEIEALPLELRKPTQDLHPNAGRGCRDTRVVQTYSDAAMSGRSANRPELQRMLSDTKTGAFDTSGLALKQQSGSASKKVNRFGRRVVDNLQSHELLAFTCVKLISVHEGEQDFLKMLLNSLGARAFVALPLRYMSAVSAKRLAKPHGAVRRVH